MQKLTKFPKQVTVKIEPDDEGGYLVANAGRDVSTHAEMNQKVKVAIYELKEVREVEGVASHRVTSN